MIIKHINHETDDFSSNFENYRRILTEAGKN